jgi:hypothetical protein
MSYSVQLVYDSGLLRVKNIGAVRENETVKSLMEVVDALAEKYSLEEISMSYHDGGLILSKFYLRKIEYRTNSIKMATNFTKELLLVSDKTPGGLVDKIQISSRK